MGVARWRLEDLPEHLRKQAAAKLAGEDPRLAPRAQDRGKNQRPAKRAGDRDPWMGATKTERRWFALHLAERCRFAEVYEPVRLRIAPGTYYTPDFVFVRDGQVVAVEVKGRYRLGSAGRAYTAFMAARDRFPWIAFEWWTAAADGGFERKH